MFVAFKIKPVTFMERLIKFFTGDNVVHCEIVTELREGSFFGLTSMPGIGVTRGWVNYNSDEWEFIELPERYTGKDLLDFYKKTKGRKYDYLGCLGFVFGNRDDPNRYFCSEWCAEFLGLDKPSRYTPGDLMKEVKKWQLIY